MHTKQKLEIIVEAAARRLVVEVLDRIGVTGHTVLTPVSGRGSGGEWDQSPVTDAQQQVMIVAIAAPDRVEAIVDEVGEILDTYHGILYVSEVQVLRSERF